MITEILKPCICDRFKNDSYYREGHLRIINALPSRKVLGLHIPDMKQIAKTLFHNYDNIVGCFEKEQPATLVHEEIVIWGLLINMQKCSLQEKFAMLGRYVPVIDNWAVCDTFCSNAKWLGHAEKIVVWDFLQQWFSSLREFEVRFAIVVSMCYFLEDDWLNRVFERIEAIAIDRIESEYITLKGKPDMAQQGTVQGKTPYYVRMAVAWLLATALAKYPEQTRLFVSQSSLPDDIVALYIRKAKESLRTRTVAPL